MEPGMLSLWKHVQLPHETRPSSKQGDIIGLLLCLPQAGQSFRQSPGTLTVWKNGILVGTCCQWLRAPLVWTVRLAEFGDCIALNPDATMPVRVQKQVGFPEYRVRAQDTDIIRTPQVPRLAPPRRAFKLWGAVVRWRRWSEWAAVRSNFESRRNLIMSVARAHENNLRTLAIEGDMPTLLRKMETWPLSKLEKVAAGAEVDPQLVMGLRAKIKTAENYGFDRAVLGYSHNASLTGAPASHMSSSSSARVSYAALTGASTTGKLQAKQQLARLILHATPQEQWQELGQSQVEVVDEWEHRFVDQRAGLDSLENLDVRQGDLLARERASKLDNSQQRQQADRRQRSADRWHKGQEALRSNRALGAREHWANAQINTKLQAVGAIQQGGIRHRKLEELKQLTNTSVMSPVSRGELVRNRVAFNERVAKEVLSSCDGNDSTVAVSFARIKAKLQAERDIQQGGIRHRTLSTGRGADDSPPKSSRQPQSPPKLTGVVEAPLQVVAAVAPDPEPEPESSEMHLSEETRLFLQQKEAATTLVSNDDSTAGSSASFDGGSELDGARKLQGLSPELEEAAHPSDLDPEPEQEVEEPEQEEEERNSVREEYEPFGAVASAAGKSNSSSSSSHSGSVGSSVDGGSAAPTTLSSQQRSPSDTSSPSTSWRHSRGNSSPVAAIPDLFATDPFADLGFRGQQRGGGSSSGSLTAGTTSSATALFDDSLPPFGLETAAVTATSSWRPSISTSRAPSTRSIAGSNTSGGASEPRDAARGIGGVGSRLSPSRWSTALDSSDESNPFGADPFADLPSNGADTTRLGPSSRADARQPVRRNLPLDDSDSDSDASSLNSTDLADLGLDRTR